MHGEYATIRPAHDRDWETPPYARGILNHDGGNTVRIRNTPVGTGNTLHYHVLL